MQKSIAKRYAKALYEIAESKSVTPALGLDNFLAHLTDLETALAESTDLNTILVNPAVPIQKRRAIIRAIGQRARWDKYFCNFVCLLVDRNKLALIKDIKIAFNAMVDASKGLVRMQIISARPLGQQEIDKLVVSLKIGSGAPVEVETRIDPTLIGGVVAHVGEKVYDASIKTQLQKVRRAILETV